MPENVQTHMHSANLLASNAQNSLSKASTVHEQNFQNVKLDLEKAEKPESKLTTSTES